MNLDRAELERPESPLSKRKREEGPKKKKKKEKKAAKPSLIVDPDSIKSRLKIDSLQQLILYVLGELNAPTWCGVRGRPQIEHVVTILVPGITPDMFGVNRQTTKPVAIPSECPLPILNTAFKYAWPVEASANKYQLHSPLSSLVQVAMNKHERKDKKGKDEPEPAITIDDLVLEGHELATNGYYIHEDVTQKELLSSNIVSTVDLGNESKVFALDCEMCETNMGKELTRVTVVDYDENTIYDKLVKPHNPIIDYLTAYSGISAELLRDVTLRLEDVQQEIKQLISSKDIIIGHSLNCDLDALQMSHPRVIDTSVCFQNPKGITFKPSLRWLSQRFLNTTIQNGSNGHDSAEDALACIKLVKSKLKHGKSYGMVKHHFIDLATKLQQHSKSTAIIDYGLPNWHNQRANSVISCYDDKSIVENTVKVARSHSFTYVRLRDVEYAARWTVRPNEQNTEPDPAEVDAKVAQLNGRLAQIYNALPESTLVIVWTGSGNPRRIRQLKNKQQTFQRLEKEKEWKDIPKEDMWTDQDAQELLAAVKEAKLGVGFVTVKNNDSVELNGDENDDGNESEHDDGDGDTQRQKRSKST